MVVKRGFSVFRWWLCSEVLSVFWETVSVSQNTLKNTTRKRPHSCFDNVSQQTSHKLSLLRVQIVLQDRSAKWNLKHFVSACGVLLEKYLETLSYADMWWLSANMIMIERAVEWKVKLWSERTACARWLTRVSSNRRQTGSQCFLRWNKPSVNFQKTTRLLHSLKINGNA